MGKKRKQFFDLRYPKTGLPVYLDELGRKQATTPCSGTSL